MARRKRNRPDPLAALQAQLGAGRVPGDSTPEHRVQLVGEAAKALIASGTKAGRFVGGALLAYLEGGGNLQRDYLQLVVPKSRRTAQVVWRELQEAENGPHTK